MATLLKVDTSLPISATIRVNFKANTMVTTGAFGYVIKGTLAGNATLGINYAPPISYVQFKGGTEITFTGTVLNNVPAVLAGTPAVNTNFAINYSAYNNMQHFVLFKAGAPITLSGGIIANIHAIKTGTLASDTQLFVNYTRTAAFRAGTQVTFTGTIINNINPVRV